MVLQRLWSKIQRHWQNRLLLVILLVFCMAIAGTFLSMGTSSQKFIEQEAINAAQQTTQALFSARDLYAQNVVQRLRQDPSVTITPNYEKIPGSIPVPATYLIELSDSIRDYDSLVRVRYFSDYPWPQRGDSGGPKDGFEQDALAHLAKNPQMPFSRVETVDGELRLRYAAADVMKASCVACHNSHPDSPKRDWRVGQMRGALTWSYPLDELQSHLNHNFSQHLFFLAGLTAIGAGGLFLGIKESVKNQLRIRTNQTLKQVNQELESRVAQRTADLKKNQEQLKLQEQAIAASHNGIIIADARRPDNPVVFVNQAFEKITGYTLSEIKGRNCRFLQGNDHEQPGLKILRQALKTGNGCEVVVRNHRKNGEEFWNELHISPIRNAQGELTHFIGIQMDVTERIHSEKNTREMNQQLSQSLREKDVLLKEIHHRVKNNLLVVSGLLSWQADLVQDPQTLEILEDSQKRIKTLALVHEKMYQSKDLAYIDLGEYLTTLVTGLVNSMTLADQRVTVTYDLCSVEMNVETITPCGLIVNELISNALEHAFPGDRQGTITLSLIRADPQLILTVCDDGVGLPPGMDYQATESMGWQLICLLAEQLEAELTVTQAPGTTVTLTFSELSYHRRL
ncbi:MAG: histidine kinase dimerization/phosphoacceptor domain -containing protein [Synechocystis sp.]|nr:histidine kinase dimerization/phosphoacceptor domain -containing protein [Synechocystis sp.]